MYNFQVRIYDPSRTHLLMSVEQRSDKEGNKMTPYSPNGVNNGEYEHPDIRGDRLNIFLLSFMYLLQGTMFGLTQAIPLILQNGKSSYTDQVRVDRHVLKNLVTFSSSKRPGIPFVGI